MGRTRSACSRGPTDAPASVVLAADRFSMATPTAPVRSPPAAADAVSPGRPLLGPATLRDNLAFATRALWTTRVPYAVLDAPTCAVRSSSSPADDEPAARRARPAPAGPDRAQLTGRVGPRAARRADRGPRGHRARRRAARLRHRVLAADHAGRRAPAGDLLWLRGQPLDELSHAEPAPTGRGRGATASGHDYDGLAGPTRWTARTRSTRSTPGSTAATRPGWPPRRRPWQAGAAPASVVGQPVAVRLARGAALLAALAGDVRRVGPPRVPGDRPARCRAGCGATTRA